MNSGPETAIAINSRYQIIEILGSGSMGTVYRTLDRLTGQTVALKQVITRRSSSRSTAHSVFLAQEFKVLASLRHPHIISVLDYGFDVQGQPYYTMPLLEGAHELPIIARQRDLNGQIDLLLQILQALMYL